MRFAATGCPLKLPIDHIFSQAINNVRVYRCLKVHCPFLAFARHAAEIFHPLTMHHDIKQLDHSSTSWRPIYINFHHSVRRLSRAISFFRYSIPSFAKRSNVPKCANNRAPDTHGATPEGWDVAKVQTALSSRSHSTPLCKFSHRLDKLSLRFIL